MTPRSAPALAALLGFVFSACALAPTGPTPFSSGSPDNAATLTDPIGLVQSPAPAETAETGCNPIECLVSSPEPGAPAPTQEAFLRRRVLLPTADEILRLANTEREALGLTSLSASATLMNLAFGRSEDMVARSYFAHTDPADGHLVAETILIGGGYAGRLGENLFSYNGPLGDLALDALAAWMSSPEERSLILDPTFSLTGVGVMGDGARWTVTQLFVESGPAERCDCEQP
ncbi:MAG TPA: CAP domain-containing protein [Anaerolineales bacterium]|nr:CAP domain-containing protein [Anaerolineales bacterium]